VTLLRLELLRFTRTRRLIALLAIFLLAGFGGPALARYLPDLLTTIGLRRRSRPSRRTAYPGWSTARGFPLDSGSPCVVPSAEVSDVCAPTLCLCPLSSVDTGLSDFLCNWT
jgi:hypothetical protein